MTDPSDTVTRPPQERITPIRLRHLFSVNCYLVSTAEGHVLIDTGFALRREDLKAWLRRADCEPGSLRLILLTHGHIDHAGSCAYLRKACDAPIAMHAGDLEKTESGDMFWGSGGSRVATAVARITLSAAGIGSFERFERTCCSATGKTSATADWTPPCSACRDTRRGRSAS